MIEGERWDKSVGNVCSRCRTEFVRREGIDISGDLGIEEEGERPSNDEEQNSAARVNGNQHDESEHLQTPAARQHAPRITLRGHSISMRQHADIRRCCEHFYKALPNTTRADDAVTCALAHRHSGGAHAKYKHGGGEISAYLRIVDASRASASWVVRGMVAPRGGNIVTAGEKDRSDKYDGEK